MGSSEDPANTRGRRTRAALLAATRAILEEQGFDALTMAAVAERAAVTRRAVYLHFASRSELVTSLFEHIAETEGLAASLARVWEAPDARSALEAWAVHIGSYHRRVLPVSQAIRMMSANDADAAAHWERVTGAQQENCRRLADRLEAEDALAAGWTVDTAADLLWALLADDFIERLLVGSAWEPEQFVARFSALLRATLLHSPGY